MSSAQFNEMLEQDQRLSRLLVPPPLSSVLQIPLNTKKTMNQGSGKPAFYSQMNEASLPVAKNSNLRPPSTARGLGRGAVRLMSTLESSSTIAPGSMATESIIDPHDFERQVLRDTGSKTTAENPVKSKLYLYDDFNFERHENSAVNLPIYKHRSHLLRAIQMNQVVIVQGSTGCGKSTQLPQFILDEAKERRVPVNIVVTQPRRIAAISLAERVSKERGWECGTIVGYQVGLNRTISDNTLLSYVTTGVLLERLVQKTCNLSEFSHVILDEIHERDVDMDLLMLIVKELLQENITTKLVLMSATLAAHKIASYFTQKFCNTDEEAPSDCVINIDGILHEVEEYYLEDLEKKGLFPSIGEYFPDESVSEMPLITLEKKQLVVDILLSITEEEQIEQGIMDLSMLQYGSVLIFLPGLSDIQDVHDYLMGIQDPNDGFSRNGIHPHYEEFRHKNENNYGNIVLSEARQRWNMIFLHSSVTVDNQRTVFKVDVKGQRKIILSTNIAESSITVPGIKYVIDFCMTKRLRYNPETKFSSLRPEWASKTNLIQRKGRAGRTIDGQVYRLIRKYLFKDLAEFCPPEMLTGPLEQVVLRTKEFGREPTSFLNRAIDPPKKTDIGHTLLTLKEAGGLTVKRRSVSGAVLASSHWEGEMTFIGRVMSSLPVDIHVAKLIALGYIFDVLDDSILMGAAMSVNKSVFMNPISNVNHDNRHRQRSANPYPDDSKCLPAYEKQLKYAAGMHSDPIAMMNAFKRYKQAEQAGNIFDKKKWCSRRYLDYKALEEMNELYIEIKRRLETKMNIYCTVREKNGNAADLDLFLLKFALAGAFYPNYFIRSYKSTAEEEATRMFGSRDPARCVQLGNLPMEEGHLYISEIEKHFKTHCMKDSPGLPRVVSRDSKIVVEFPEMQRIRNDNETDPEQAFDNIYVASLPVYLALRMSSPRSRLKPLLNRVRLTPEDNNRLNDIIAQHRHSESLTTPKNASDKEKRQGVTKHVGYPAPHIEWINILPKFLIECGSFYGIYEEYAENEIELLDLIYNYISSGPVQLANPSVGKMCIAPDTDLMTKEVIHSRAKIMSVEKQKATAFVFFVDFGSTCWVPFTDLKELPRNIDNCCPHLAVEFVLCELKPPVNGTWSVHHLQAMDEIFNLCTEQPWPAQIYSVVNNKVRVKVHKPNGSETMNDLLIQKGAADFGEEPFTSRQDHANRTVAVRVYQNSDKANSESDFIASGNADPHWADETHLIEDFIRKCGKRNYEKIRLTGPDHPHKMSFVGLSRAAAGKRVLIPHDSVNHIVIDPEPQNPHTRMLVAGVVHCSPRDQDDLIIRQTTLLPHIPGLPFLVCMIFAPVVECRSDEFEIRYTGCISGLGYDTNNFTNNPSNDVEVPCDVRFDTEDLRYVNDLRLYMSSLLEEWKDQAFLTRRDDLRVLIKDFIALLKKKDLVSTTHPKKAYHWLQVSEDRLILPDIEDDPCTKPIPYIPHCGLNRVGFNFHRIFYKLRELDASESKESYADWEIRCARYLLANHKFLVRMLNSTTENNLGNFVVCEACNSSESMNSKSNNIQRGFVMYNRINLQEHLNSQEHQDNVKYFLFIGKTEN